jgi:hypothetical protein
MPSFLASVIFGDQVIETQPEEMARELARSADRLQVV